MPRTTKPSTNQSCSKEIRPGAGSRDWRLNTSTERTARALSLHRLDMDSSLPEHPHKVRKGLLLSAGPRFDPKLTTPRWLPIADSVPFGESTISFESNAEAPPDRQQKGSEHLEDQHRARRCS